MGYPLILFFNPIIVFFHGSLYSPSKTISPAWIVTSLDVICTSVPSVFITISLTMASFLSDIACTLSAPFQACSKSAAGIAKIHPAIPPRSLFVKYNCPFPVTFVVLLIFTEPSGLLTVDSFTSKSPSSMLFCVGIFQSEPFRLIK